MAYEELGNVEVVSLGGLNKKTGKKNPAEIEGYLTRVESRPNRFNEDKPQKFYVFLTSNGEKGVYGKAGIDSSLRAAKLGLMTKLVATGETLDTGKGFPMKVFKAMQDRNNALDQAALESYSQPTSDAESDESYEELFEAPADEESVEEVAPARPKAPVRAATVDPARQAKIQALLNSRK